MFGDQSHKYQMEDRDFQARKKNTADFMIEFKVLAMKADTDKLHVIFLLKNVWLDIIKIILGYPLIAVPKILKEWKVAIKGYESTEK